MGVRQGFRLVSCTCVAVEAGAGCGVFVLSSGRKVGERFKCLVSATVKTCGVECQQQNLRGSVAAVIAVVFFTCECCWGPLWSSLLESVMRFSDKSCVNL